MQHSPSIPSTLAHRRVRRHVLRLLSIRFQHAHDAVPGMVEVLFRGTRLHTDLEACWRRLLEDHGIGDTTHQMADILQPGGDPAKHPAPPTAPMPWPRVAGGVRRAPGRAPWRKYLDIVLCSVSSTLAAVLASWAWAELLPDVPWQPAVTTALSIGAAWMSERWLCQILVRREAAEALWQTTLRTQLVHAFRNALALAHCRQRIWVYGATTLFSSPDEAPHADAGRLRALRAFWRQQLASTVLAHAAQAMARIDLSMNGQQARAFFDETVSQIAGPVAAQWQTIQVEACEWSCACRATVLMRCDDVPGVSMAPMLANALEALPPPPEPRWRFTRLLNQAATPIAGGLEAASREAGALARMLGAALQAIGRRMPESEALRHAGLFAKGSGALVAAAPVLATLLDIVVRVQALHGTRDRERHARSVRDALRDAFREHAAIMARQLSATVCRCPCPRSVCAVMAPTDCPEPRPTCLPTSQYSPRTGVCDAPGTDRQCPATPCAAPALAGRAS
ncbi:hypothetical protein SAMN05216345_110149 [Cupriavidus sp. YR651]|nr:hypothetical protein SAMN05216345_110149 [Cupriavidus sp. YR651]